MNLTLLQSIHPLRPGMGHEPSSLYRNHLRNWLPGMGLGDGCACSWVRTASSLSLAGIRVRLLRSSKPFNTLIIKAAI